MLVVVFACKKFHDFTFGREEIIETDHLPLVSIHKKPLYSAPMRLQKMLLKLQPYDIVLQYKEGSDLYVADALSRAYLPASSDNDITDDDDYDIMLVTPLTPSKMEELRHETGEDTTLQQLMAYSKHGWPDNVKCVTPELKQFFGFRDEVTCASGVIMKGDKLLVPASLQASYTKQLHKGHVGADACKRRARDTLYWTTMIQDIDSFVAHCAACTLAVACRS